MKDKNILAHTTWNCKYHIVFAPKYRRQIIYGKYKRSIGQIIRDLIYVNVRLSQYMRPTHVEITYTC